VSEKEQGPKQPPASFQMEFCQGCGRNDLVRPLAIRHYWKGELCAGPLTTLSYDLVQPPVDPQQVQLPQTTYKTKPPLEASRRFQWRKALNDYAFNNCDHEHGAIPNHLTCIECAFECFDYLLSCIPLAQL
jgi:hypothetical protein